MKNAMTELMEIATHVTKTNDELGVAYFIDKLIAGEQNCDESKKACKENPMQ